MVESGGLWREVGGKRDVGRGEEGSRGGGLVAERGRSSHGQR